MGSGVPQNSFLRLPSTWVMVVVRILIFVASSTLPSSPWWNNGSLTQVLINSSYTLERVQEAIFIQQLSGGSFISAYAAHPRVDLPPLLLAGLLPLTKSKYAELYIFVLCLLMDLLLAAMLEAIARIALFTNRIEEVDKESNDQEKLPDVLLPSNRDVFAIFKGGESSLLSMESLPLLTAQFYFLSPVTALSGSAYPCFQCLPSFLLVASLHEIVRPGGSPPIATFWLANASYLQLHYVVFLVPLLVMPIASRRQAQIFGSFVFWFACIQWTSYQLVGEKNLIQVAQATYGMGWRTIRPSLSLQWYLAMQLFSRFRDYFGCLLLWLPYILVIPIATRLSKYPMSLVAIFSMIWTIFRPVETLYDATFSLALLLMCPRSLARMGPSAFFAISSMLVPVILGVVDHWMWLGPNTGNANYIFFQCLAFNVFLAIILSQFVNGSLERAKSLRLAAKEREDKSSTLD